MTTLTDLVGTVRQNAGHGRDEDAALALHRWTAPRVNLLPPEVSARRTVRRAKLGAVAATGAALLVVTGAWLLGGAAASSAQDDLDLATSRVSALQAQQSEYAAAPQTIASLEAAQTARSSAMAQDVAWSAYVDSLARALPAGAWLVGVQAGLAAGPATTDGTASLGTVTLTASATSYEDVASYLDALAAVPGTADPYLTTSTQDSSGGTPVVSFTVTAQMTSEALSHRFDQAADPSASTDPATDQEVG